MVDTPASGAGAYLSVQVQLLSKAHNLTYWKDAGMIVYNIK